MFNERNQSSSKNQIIKLGQLYKPWTNFHIKLFYFRYRSLGIDHDEDDGCGVGLAAKNNIMVKKLFATSSNFKWSRCSAKMIWQNLK